MESSRKIFTKRGYKLAFSNVKVFYNGSVCDFEDWWYYPDLIDKDIIDKLDQINNKGLMCDKIKEILFSL